MGMRFCNWLSWTFVDSFKIFAEVPRGAWNNHMDLILINYRKKKCLGVELKLRDVKGLKTQIDKAPYTTCVKTMGVINRSVDRSENRNRSMYEFGVSQKLDEWLLEYLLDEWNWGSIFRNTLSIIYYYAFYFDKSSYAGIGLPKRDYVLYLLFQKAIENMFRIEDKVLSFDIIQSSMPIYSEQVAKKYYNRVVKEYKKAVQKPLLVI